MMLWLQTGSILRYTVVQDMLRRLIIEWDKDRKIIMIFLKMNHNRSVTKMTLN